ncbi:MAG: hypothetical protein HYY57_07345 [Candidatus Omnitrophica bacterium]|nr:hypothetical protein [Candidatus Omnitrophota bacterium]
MLIADELNALGSASVWRVTLRWGPHPPQPTTPIVRRGEDGWGSEAAGPVKLRHHYALGVIDRIGASSL